MAPEVVEQTLDLLRLSAEDTVVDLGCGDARALIAAATQRGARGIGWEIEPERADEAKMKVKEAGLEVRSLP